MFNAAELDMKASLKFLFVLTAVAALSVAYPAKANLITNGGFETGDFTGWTRSGNIADAFVAGSVHGVSPHSGNFQAVVDARQAFDSVNLTQTLATTPGANYTIDFWVALGGVPSNSFINVQWGAATVFSLTTSSGFGYTEHILNVTGSTASTDLTFVLGYGGSAIVTWYLDDISVNPAGVGVPDGGSTVSLLGFALLGLAAVRRKLRC